MKHTIRWIVIAVIVVIAGLWIGFKYWNGTPAAEQSAEPKMSKNGGKATPVDVHIVQQEQVLDGIRAVGSLLPNEQVELSCEISGKISQLLFEEGTAVTKGQVLVRINDDDLQAQMKRYQFQEKTLSEKLERQRILFAKEAVSRETYDQVQTEYNVLLADMQILQVKIDKSSIRAPFSGTIGFRYVSQGSYIQPNTPIANMVDYNTLKIEFSIPEKYINTPLVGKNAYFTTESNPTPQKAIIYAMEPTVDENTRTIILRAKYSNVSGKLRPGMSARVTIPTSESASVLMVPTQAIVPSLSGKSVWVVRDGAPVLQEVETGTRQQANIEVLKGLQLGDSVIITGLMQLREGAKITIN